MAAKKGKIPAHVKKKNFPTPMHNILLFTFWRARNLAVVRKIALNAVSKETSIKGGIATRQYAASFNPAYRDKILKNLF